MQQQATMPPLPSSTHIPATPPPTYSDSNSTRTTEPKNPTLALNSVPPSAWITAKDIAVLRDVPYLTGMRAIASILIQVLHMAKPETPYIGFFAVVSLSTHFIQGAYLITGALLFLQARNTPSKARFSIYQHLPQFFLSRWFRLYPAVIIVLAINSIWWSQRFHNPTHLAKMVFRQFFKISQFKFIFYISNDGYPPNPFANMWFLEVQEHFYIFWGFILPFIIKFKSLGRFVCLAILFGLSFRMRWKEESYNATLPLNLYKMIFGAAIYLFPIPRSLIMNYANKAAIVAFAFTFICGMSPTFRYNLTSAQRRMYGDNFAIVLVVLVILAAIAKGINDSDPDYQRKRKAYLAQCSAEEVDQPIYMVYYQRLTNWDPLTLLDAKWLQFVGRISYSWYLWQVPLLHWKGQFRNGISDALGPTCMAFICAMISTYFVEEPIRNAYSAYVKRQRIKVKQGLEPNTVKSATTANHVSISIPFAKDSHQE